MRNDVDRSTKVLRLYIKMASDDYMRNELQAMRLRADKITDESLESTERMKQLVFEAQNAGASTLIQLDEQGEQLDNVEGGMDQIDADMKIAQENLYQMQMCCGLCICPWKKESNFEKTAKYENAWEQQDRDVVVKAQPVDRSYTKDSSKVDNSGYINRITHDNREDTMDQNLGEISGVLSNLKGMAVEMGTEIDEQNRQIDRINLKAESNQHRIQSATRTASKVLRS